MSSVFSACPLWALGEIGLQTKACIKHISLFQSGEMAAPPLSYHQRDRMGTRAEATIYTTGVQMKAKQGLRYIRARQITRDEHQINNAPASILRDVQLQGFLKYLLFCV